MSGEYVLSVDLGTGGPKVALVSLDGEVLTSEATKNRLVLLPGGGAEQDPEEWWRTITHSLRSLVARGLVPARDIIAIGVTSQWFGTVAVDRGGRPLADAVIWMDSRGAKYVAGIVGGRIPLPGTGYDALKLPRWLRLTGGLPSLSGKDPVGHALFLKHERPDVYRAAYKLLEPMDYLTMRLTGVAVASYASVTGYWCTDNRDLSAVRYDDDLVARTGIDRSKLPDLVPTGSVIGELAAQVARDLGLPPGVLVVTATGDTASAAIGAGAVADYAAHLYVGTSSWLSCHVPFKKTDVATNIASLPSGIPGKYWIAAEQEAAGKCLTWLVEQVLYPEDAFGSGAAPADVLARLNEVAASVPAGSHGVIFLPWLNGERTPVDDRFVRGGWFNVSLTTGRDALVRSVLEGVALNARWMLGAVESFARKQRPEGFSEIRFVGGGASSPLWCQIFADVLDRRILQIESPVLANVRGAAMATAVALGRLRWEDVPRRVNVARIYEPIAEHRSAYDRLYPTFLELYARTKPLYTSNHRNAPRVKQSPAADIRPEFLP